MREPGGDQGIGAGTYIVCRDGLELGRGDGLDKVLEDGHVKVGGGPGDEAFLEVLVFPRSKVGWLRLTRSTLLMDPIGLMSAEEQSYLVKSVPS